jgi:hypothetical protein
MEWGLGNDKEYRVVQPARQGYKGWQSILCNQFLDSLKVLKYHLGIADSLNLHELVFSIVFISENVNMFFSL